MPPAPSRSSHALAALHRALDALHRALDARRCVLVALVAVAAASTACSAPRPPPLEPMAELSFRPTQAGEQLWLSTPSAIEVRTEREARLLEAADPSYIGELGVSATHIPTRQQALLPQLVAAWGATHYRIVSAGDGLRVDVHLYRIERDRWHWLPEELRPVAPTDSVLTPEPQDPQASL